MPVIRKSFGLVALMACSAAAFGQAAYDPGCWPPMSTTGPSADYIVYKLTDDPAFIAGPTTNNSLFGVSVGALGSDTYDNPVCPYGGTFNAAGCFGFTSGSVGSIQSDVDNYLRLTYGMPYMVGGSIGYTLLVSQAADGTGQEFIRFGSEGFNLVFVGLSDRYCVTEGPNGQYQVRLRVDSIGDAARFSYRITNTAADAARVGLWMGARLDFLDQSGFFVYPEYIQAPGYLPFNTAQRFRRDAEPGNPDKDPFGTDILPLPPYLNFSLSQENAYGLQLPTGPILVNGQPNSDQTPVDELVIGSAGFVLGNDPDDDLDEMADVSIFDSGVGRWAFINKWEPQIIAAGGVRTINAFYKTTWGVSSYYQEDATGRPTQPFSVVVDAPHVIATDPNDPNRFTPNPHTFRVYVDNTGGYSDNQREITLNNVRVEVTLPPGMRNAANPSQTNLVGTIPQVRAREFGFVDFQVEVTPDAVGTLPYTVNITTTTGARSTLTGAINVATTPRLNLPATANLVGSPWSYNVENWESVLGLQVNQDFQAFTYDPQQQEYVIQTGPQRGRGTWLVFDTPQGVRQLGGTPSEPGDLVTGNLQVTLQPGWNLIANPYNYAIPLSLLLGVPAAAPGDPLSYDKLVYGNFISSALAYWDNTSPTPEYRYISNSFDLMVPNRGYWIFVNTAQSLLLQFPPVTDPFLPARFAVPTAQPVSTSGKEFKLQLAARTDKMVDAQNFVGVAGNEAAAKKAAVQEAPVPPVDGALSLSIKETIGGKTSKMATSLVDKIGKHSWNVEVYTKEAGQVTVTWPNLAAVPKNVQFRVVDAATGRATNLRRASGYTFQAEERSVRKFTVEMEPGAAPRPVIGLVTAERSGKAANAPLSIRYTLSSDSTTTVRILSGGREVSMLARARADKSGQHNIVWNLRDSANRAVAPGPYTVEITAESTEGERVRRFFPINIIR